MTMASCSKAIVEVEIMNRDKRIAWPRPRHKVIALVGAENQSLPLFILAKGDRSVHQAGEYEGNAFVPDKDAILAVLAERHGFPNPHP